MQADGEALLYLQIGADLEDVQEILQQLLLLLLIASPVLVSTAGLGGYWLAGQTLAPVELIRRQAAAVSAQELNHRLDLDLPDDEVGHLAQTFDGMLARLEESFQQQRRFVADASHELRTPLTAIAGELDVTLSRDRSQAEYQESLQRMQGEVQCMRRLVSDLLLARSDNVHWISTGSGWILPIYCAFW